MLLVYFILFLLANVTFTNETNETNLTDSTLRAINSFITSPHLLGLEKTTTQSEWERIWIHVVIVSVFLLVLAIILFVFYYCQRCYKKEEHFSYLMGTSNKMKKESIMKTIRPEKKAKFKAAAPKRRFEKEDSVSYVPHTAEKNHSDRKMQPKPVLPRRPIGRKESFKTASYIPSENSDRKVQHKPGKPKRVKIQESVSCVRDAEKTNSKKRKAKLKASKPERKPSREESVSDESHATDKSSSERKIKPSKDKQRKKNRHARSPPLKQRRRR